MVFGIRYLGGSGRGGADGSGGPGNTGGANGNGGPGNTGGANGNGGPGNTGGANGNGGPGDDDTRSEGGRALGGVPPCSFECEGMLNVTARLPPMVMSRAQRNKQM
jgi:hypothetical protein